MKIQTLFRPNSTKSSAQISNFHILVPFRSLYKELFFDDFFAYCANSLVFHVGTGYVTQFKSLGKLRYKN